MQIQTIQHNNTKIAEFISNEMLIAAAEDGADLVGNLYFEGFDKAILHKKNISPAFFDLKTGIAGEVLQKFSTYRIRLAIVGDFSSYESKSVKDFIFESNKMGHINFVSSKEEALEKLSK